MLPHWLRELPRRRAAIVVSIAVVVVFAAIVLLWSSGKSGSTAAFCSSVRTAENPLDVFNQYDPTNPDAARQVLQPGLDRLRALQRAAPGEIEGDMKVLVDFTQQLVTALDTSVTNKTIPDLNSEAGQVQAASVKVTQFAADKCGVQLESTTSSVPATVSSATPTT